MLNLSNCCAGYTQEIFHKLNLTIYPGQLTTLIGPNGCGKTTLLRILSRNFPLARGALTVNGTDARTLTPREYAKMVAYLPQARPVPQITVAALVAHGRFPYLPFPRKLRAEDIKCVNNALDALHLSQDRDRNLQELSGGERQRVYLAMLLAQDSHYFLLDEPTTYLDLHHQFEILHLLQNFSHAGRGIFMVLHDITSAFSYSDRIIIMQSGKILADGSPQELLHSPVIPQVFRVQIRVLIDANGCKNYFAVPM